LESPWDLGGERPARRWQGWGTAGLRWSFLLLELRGAELVGCQWCRPAGYVVIEVCIV